MKMSSQSAVVIASAVAIFASASLADTKEVVGELKNCARIGAHETRVACYEALGKRVLEEDSSMVSSPNPAPAASTTLAPAVSVSAVSEVAPAPVAPGKQEKINDTMGGYQYADKPSDHPGNDIHIRVIRCQQDRDKVWYFKFENGQVWKQVDRTTRRFKDCDFPVVLSKDGFGYKMQIEGKGGKIRISRRK